MLFGQRPERGPLFESVPRQFLVLVGQGFNRHPQVIKLVVHGLQIRGCLQADAVLGRRACLLLDPLEHPVQCGACEVRLGVWELGLVVRAGSLGDGQEALALQVLHVQTLLPARPGLNEVLGEDQGKIVVLSRQFLSCL